MDNSKRINYGIDISKDLLKLSLSQSYEFNANSSYNKDLGLNDYMSDLLGTISFDGLNENVSVPITSSLQKDNISISAWVKPGDLTGSLYTVVGFQEAFNLKLERNDSNAYSISVHIKTDDLWGSGLADTSVDLNKWNHIAATYDGSMVRLYLDGMLDGSFTKSGDLSVTGGMSIGSRNINTEYFKGGIDEVQVWNRTLSSEEIFFRKYESFDPTEPFYSDLKGV